MRLAVFEKPTTESDCGAVGSRRITDFVWRYLPVGPSRKNAQLPAEPGPCYVRWAPCHAR